MHVTDDASRSDSEPAAGASPTPSPKDTEREESLSLEDGFDEDSDMALDEIPPPRRRRRSPLVAGLVVMFGTYLLVSMWPDFRHWLRSTDAVEDLGHARDLIVDGKFVRDFDNAYVEVEATVDLQHAAKLTTAKGEARYLRLPEGGMSLFAQIPQVEGERADTVPDRFRGRMRRHGDTSSFVWARKFFENEAIVQTIDVTLDSAATGQRNDAGDVVLSVVDEDRTVTLGERDELRLVVPATTAVVQLGKTTWPDAASAREAMVALAVPFIQAERQTVHAHVFVAAIPIADRQAAQARLQAGREIPADNADPKVGATVLSRTNTYAGTADTIEWLDDGWRVPLGYAHPGYEVRGETLVPRPVENDRITVRRDQVTAARVDQTLELDEDGYLIIVGEDPASQRLTAILFFVVCGIMAANLASLVLWARSRS